MVLAHHGVELPTEAVAQTLFDERHDIVCGVDQRLSIKRVAYSLISSSYFC